MSTWSLSVGFKCESEGSVGNGTVIGLFGCFVDAPLAVGACSLVDERGSGNVATESRDVSGFDQVDMSVSGTVLTR